MPDDFSDHISKVEIRWEYYVKCTHIYNALQCIKYNSIIFTLTYTCIQQFLK